MLTESQRKNFDTLRQVFQDGNALLVECTDALTGKPVAVICARSSEGGEEITLVPFAKFFDGDPYEQLIPPALEGDSSTPKGKDPSGT